MKKNVVTTSFIALMLLPSWLLTHLTMLMAINNAILYIVPRPEYVISWERDSLTTRCHGVYEARFSAINRRKMSAKLLVELPRVEFVYKLDRMKSFIVKFTVASAKHYSWKRGKWLITCLPWLSDQPVDAAFVGQLRDIHKDRSNWYEMEYKRELWHKAIKN